MLAAGLMQASETLAAMIERTATGDRSAFGSLYDATASRVFGLALKMLRTHEDAEEITLDTFSQVWSQADRFDRDRGGAITWILTLARTRALDRIRSRSREVWASGSMDSALTIPDERSDPERDSERSERAALIRDALADLPREQREVIEAVYFGGLSHAEVAEARRLPLGTVKTRLRSGLSALRRSIPATQGDLA